MTLVSQLAGLTALNTEGQTVVLGGLWQERSLVLVFLRHFG